MFVVFVVVVVVVVLVVVVVVDRFSGSAGGGMLQLGSLVVSWHHRRILHPFTPKGAYGMHGKKTFASSHLTLQSE